MCIRDSLVTLQSGNYLRRIIRALSSVKLNADGTQAYEVYHSILNTKDLGVPQNRPRWYCVGLRKDINTKSTFEFPRRLPCPSIELFLDADSSQSTQGTTSSLSKTAKTNIANATAKILRDGGKPALKSYIVDCDASISKSRYTFDYSPCLTRSRYNGHWITNKERRMNKSEVCRLQGFNPSDVVVDIPESALGQQLGNAMSVNVIEQVIRNVLEVLGYKQGEIPATNRWADGTAIQQIKTKEVTLKRQGEPLPDFRIIQRIAAAKGISHAGKRRDTIVDSGATYHLVDEADLSLSLIHI